ncbi:metallophosphoesterase family protein [Anaeromyxobacter paludicola]|uniref:Metallophosphoesterase n=1 Tax=Anaeromyxobacter paludicola TaxID=2918171 RepID=A0ABM7X7B4_9BACT|nr:metallophosphoesterase family protein [Anaeromyxobacter paludicola]BDG07725.1 metallophosphoesterase [Anaeromyxobacter paludicola]
MRIAILSDVHANLEALERVVSRLKLVRVDRVVCLGDVIGYGASPRECCRIVRETAEVTLLGNHDAAVSGRMDYRFYYEAARRALDWTLEQLDPEDVNWLRGLPYAHRIGEAGFCHGSPIDPPEYAYLFALEQARELLPHLDWLPAVTFIGHSHLCKSFAIGAPDVVEDVSGTPVVLRKDRKYLVSVGSVGQPRDGDNRACFAVWDDEARTVSYHRVTYDVDAAARRIFDAGLARNFGRRLFLGV